MIYENKHCVNQCSGNEENAKLSLSLARARRDETTCAAIEERLEKRMNRLRADGRLATSVNSSSMRIIYSAGRIHFDN